MKPIELDHIETFLKDRFAGKGDLPDLSALTDREKEVNFLSKALAAFALQIFAGIDTVAAAKCVCDGSRDRGIDAFHYSSQKNLLTVVQSKFIQKGAGQPDLKDVSPFPLGVAELLDNNLGAFNKAIQDRKTHIEAALDDPKLKVQIVLVDTGDQFKDELALLFENLIRNINSKASPDYARFDHLDYKLIHEEIIESFQRNPINVTLTLSQWGLVTTPLKCCYGQISASVLAELFIREKDKLVERNIRKFRGLTVVNDRIAETVAKTPDEFFYLNNGVTAICSNLDILPRSRGNRDAGMFKITDLSIVNGAQTVGAIAAQYAKTRPETEPLVFIKVIAVQDRGTPLGDRITRATNFQNRVERVDFVALDDVQKRLQHTLSLSEPKIHYHFKKDDGSVEKDEQNFFVEEATVALACLESLENVVPLKRDPGDFWDIEEKENSRYRRLFNSSLSARTMWRATQIARIVFEMTEDRYRISPRSPRGKCYKHSRYLVLHLVFLRTKLATQSSLNLTEAEKTELSRATDLIVETLCDVAIATFGQKEFYAVFKNVTDCADLRSRVCNRLNATVVPAPVPLPIPQVIGSNEGISDNQTAEPLLAAKSPTNA